MDRFLQFLALRVLSAVTTRTLFQPDEYYQALEPALSLIGEDAYRTWEWEHQLRSSMLPWLFAGVYKASATLSSFLNLSPSNHEKLWILAPGLAQAFIAAVGDTATCALARRLYGPQSRKARLTEVMTLFSPWLWFAATRTLANGTETTLTAIALLNWPLGGRSKGTGNLGLALVAAAVACVLRPTNVLLWLPLAVPALSVNFIITAVLAGTGALLLSSGLDRWFYGFWTFPPLKFLQFNIAKGLSVFYGSNAWFYYISEGLPLLLTTRLPFALSQMWHTASIRGIFGNPEQRFTSSICFVLIVMSLISHKEVRFIYPLLPMLHILAAGGAERLLYPRKSTRLSRARKPLTWVLLVLSLAIAYYASQVHQRGPLDALSFIRKTHVSRSPPRNETLHILMPCHSIPWRSHIVYPGLSARALTCEPPINIPPGTKARENYLDEADIFYKSPLPFLSKIYNPKQNRPNFKSGTRYGLFDPDRSIGRPDYVMFFAQLENEVMKNSPVFNRGYEECFRGFSSHVHDDWRRRGDVIVWCKK